MGLLQELAILQEDKTQLESQLITVSSRNQAMQIEFKKLEDELSESQKRLCQYEKALEKVSFGGVL